MKTLVADSGGTKTDWVMLKNAGSEFFKTAGLHPSYVSSNQITAEVRKTISEAPDEIYFYGAGCHGAGPIRKIKQAIHAVFTGSKVFVHDDLTGVARAHLQWNDGVIAALGTGSICGRYQNGEIVERSAALGYAIGDEGSAADLGRTILKAYLRKTLGKETQELIKIRLGSDSYSEWMDRIYNSERPNRELAAVAALAFKLPLNSELREVVMNCFLKFIDTQLIPLSADPEGPIVYTGSVAVAHGEILFEAMQKRGIEQVSIEKNVIEGLAIYHSHLC